MKKLLAKLGYAAIRSVAYPSHEFIRAIHEVSPIKKIEISRSEPYSMLVTFHGRIPSYDKLNYNLRRAGLEVVVHPGRGATVWGRFVAMAWAPDREHKTLRILRYRSGRKESLGYGSPRVPSMDSELPFSKREQTAMRKVIGSSGEVREESTRSTNPLN